MKKIIYFLSIFILFLFNINNVSAKVIDYQFMGKKVNQTFSISANSSLIANTFINVTEDSTANYLVVDLCSTVQNNITVTVPDDYDGSYTMFYKSYDLNESCSTGSYNGNKIRLFFNTTTFADSGNGNMAINNNTKIVNNKNYTAVFKVISMGLTDSIDLGDLTINNQNIIINNINGLQNSLNDTESNIKDSLSDTESNIKDSLNDTESNIKDSLSDMEDSINSSIDEQLGNKCDNILNSSLKSPKTHRGITFTPILNKDNIVESFTVSGTRTSGENAYVAIMNGVNLKKGTKIYVYSEGVALQLYDSSINWVKNIYDSYTLTEDKNNLEIDVFTSLETLENVEFKAKITLSDNSSYCVYGSYSSKLDDTNNQLNDLNDNITNSDISGASGEAGDFFSNFNTDTFGLTSVITAPLELIKSVTSKTCTPLHGTLPFVDTVIDLPCLTTIYESHFGSFLTIYRTITFGFVSYWVCIKIFNLVKDFKNPEHDEIEVLDL